MIAGAAVVRSARRGELQRARELASGGVNELAAGNAALTAQQRERDDVANRRVEVCR